MRLPLADAVLRFQPSDTDAQWYVCVGSQGMTKSEEVVEFFQAQFRNANEAPSDRQI